jgi:hypothetical protein
MAAAQMAKRKNNLSWQASVSVKFVLIKEDELWATEAEMDPTEAEMDPHACPMVWSEVAIVAGDSGGARNSGRDCLFEACDCPSEQVGAEEKVWLSVSEVSSEAVSQVK